MFTGRVRSASMMTQMMGYREVLSNLVCDRCKSIRVYEKTSVLEKTIRLAVEKRSTTYQIPSLALHPLTLSCHKLVPALAGEWKATVRRRRKGDFKTSVQLHVLAILRADRPQIHHVLMNIRPFTSPY